EIVNIFLVLGECRGNYHRSAALYHQRFPRRRHHPNDSTIRITERREERRRIRKRNRQLRNRNNIEDVRIIAVLGMVAMNPHVSTRQIESELGIPRNTAARLLRSLKFFFWGLLKDIVFARAPTMKNDMKERISQVRQKVTRNLLLSSIQHYVFRL
ncbi:hypothetical protein ALC60_13923, partial [Trachymyrmex zeteki]